VVSREEAAERERALFPRFDPWVDRSSRDGVRVKLDMVISFFFRMSCSENIYTPFF